MAVAAVLAVTAAAMAALGPAGPAAASSGTTLVKWWGQGRAMSMGDTYSPSSVNGNWPTNMTQVSGGADHTLALRSDGTVWAWGDNGSGELGNGTTTPGSPMAVQVTGLTGVVQVAAGYEFSLALRSDGTVWAWGNNGWGQLGDGSITDRTTPVQVSGLAKVTQIAAGDLHSLAVRSDGTVVAWGNNRSGQLGDGTTTYRTNPVQVSGLTKVIQIAGGYSYSAAVRSDGTAVTWGYNGLGQLGDGTTTERLTPVTVSGLTGVTQIAAGWSHSLAVRSNGTAWAWGSNNYGELGDGTTTGRTVPVAVSGLTDVTRVSVGYQHNVALRLNGAVVAWGYNRFGQLGDGTTTTRITPVIVPGLSGVTQVSAGWWHTLAKVGPPELTAKATITGTGNVGATLTCKAAFLTATSVIYTWRRDTTTIPGATTATYVPVAADAGHKATCQVTGTNTAGSTDTSATITVHAPAHFTPGTTPTAHVGRRYSHRFAATGSPTPKIALVSGKLPPGLKLAADGTLSGTPKRAGTYRFTLSATNGVGAPAKANERVTVR